MERTELAAGASAGGPSINVDGTDIVTAPSTARLSVVIEGDVAISDDAMARIMGVLNREAKRFAEIAFVDARDQKAAVIEADRVRSLPTDRPHILAIVGRKDPESVLVLKGEYDVSFGKAKRTLRAAKEDRA